MRLRYVFVCIFILIINSLVQGCLYPIPTFHSDGSGGDLENIMFDASEPSPDVVSEPSPDVVSEPSPDVVSEPSPDVVSDTPPDDNTTEKCNTPGPLKPYSVGACPVLQAGEVRNFVSSYVNRAFYLSLPKDPKKASLLFLWHRLGIREKTDRGSFEDFRKVAQNISQKTQTIVVIPRPNTIPALPDDLPDVFKEILNGIFKKRPSYSLGVNKDDDLHLFDDILYCLEKQFSISRKKVYTAGFELGAVWSTYLSMHRSEYLAASLLFSGGTLLEISDLSQFIGLNAKIVSVDVQYKSSTCSVPILSASGGTDDKAYFSNKGVTNIQDMHASSLELQASLKEDNRLFVSCNHGEGHTILQDAFEWGLEFLLKHEFGKESPYKSSPLSSTFPSYCNLHLGK